MAGAGVKREADRQGNRVNEKKRRKRRFHLPLEGEVERRRRSGGVIARVFAMEPHPGPLCGPTLPLTGRVNAPLPAFIRLPWADCREAPGTDIASSPIADGHAMRTEAA